MAGLIVFIAWAVITITVVYFIGSFIREGGKDD